LRQVEHHSSNDRFIDKIALRAQRIRGSHLDRFGATAVPSCAKFKKNATAEWLSKTRVFERVCRTGKVTGKSGLNLSQNSFLISASQKARVRLSFERVMTINRTKTGHTAARAKRQRSVAAKVARARSSGAGDITSKPMLIGYARVSTVDQNLALQREHRSPNSSGEASTNVVQRRSDYIHKLAGIARVGLQGKIHRFLLSRPSLSMHFVKRSLR
jgi:hypothetical protein